MFNRLDKFFGFGTFVSPKRCGQALTSFTTSQLLSPLAYTWLPAQNQAILFNVVRYLAALAFNSFLNIFLDGLYMYRETRIALL
jgi:hypothetical protein